MLSWPSLVFANVGKFVSNDDLKLVLLTHRCFEPILTFKEEHSWIIDNGFDLDKALLYLAKMPNLKILNVMIRTCPISLVSPLILALTT